MGPLSGIRVVEIAGLAPAPFGCMMLADLGAEVLRVDRLGSSGALMMLPGPLDRGKRTVSANLKTPEGVEAVRALAAEADVFVEGFRPGVAERLGIGPDDLMAANERLVYARMTGWGQEGPLKDRAGHDINYLAVSGMLQPLARDGHRPTPPHNLLADFAGGGVMMAFGILSALVERATSGKGQVIDAAMVDGASLYSAFMRGMNDVGLWSDEPGTNMLDGGAAFYDTYECSDGKHVAVGCVEPHFFDQMVSILGIEDDSLPHQIDPSGWDGWRAKLSEVFRTKTRDEWAEIFGDTDACVSPVLSPWEAPEYSHNSSRNSFFELDGIVQPSPAPRFSRSEVPTPKGLDDGGRDVAATLAEWGFSAERVQELLDKEAVG